MPTAANVYLGKPNATGAVFVAPAGTAVPTDATTALDPAFKDCGFLDSTGLTNSTATNTTDVVAWGGDTVMSVRSSRAETFIVPMIETTVDVLKAVYGATNVTVDTTTQAITCKHSNDLPDECVWVFEVMLTNKRVKRIVVPRGVGNSLADVVYSDGNPITYNPTISALPDASGNTAYEYIATIA